MIAVASLMYADPDSAVNPERKKKKENQFQES